MLPDKLALHLGRGGGIVVKSTNSALKRVSRLRRGCQDIGGALKYQCLKSQNPVHPRSTVCRLQRL